MDWLIGIKWWEISIHLTIILSNVKAIGLHILTVSKITVLMPVYNNIGEQETLLMKSFNIKLYLEFVCTHLSLGSRPSLVYCQQMSPIRS